jgi:hypothetical protein
VHSAQPEHCNFQSFLPVCFQLGYLIAMCSNCTVQVTASNDIVSSAGNTTEIVVMEGVNYTVISGPMYVRTGVPTAFTVEPHTGARITVLD